MREEPAEAARYAQRPGIASPRPVMARPIPVTSGVKGVAAPPVPPDPDREDGVDQITAIVIDKSPPWLFSLAFHMLAMIIMGLIVYVHIPRKSIHLNAETIYAEKLGNQLEFDSPLGVPDVETTAESAAITPDKLPVVDDPFAAPTDLAIRPTGKMATSDIKSPQIGLALSGRKEGSAKKSGLIGKYGGNALTEAAVKKGLAWLARNQQRNGSWSLTGPYSDGVSRDLDNQAAATAMALLAFQGAGNTHQEGKFKRNVTKGWRWLLKQEDANGCFFQNGGFNHRFYTQGQCAIAICELYGMSKDPKYKEPAQRAIDYCLRSQSPEGGWRYSPNTDSDVSVTGWIVMALQSARMADLEVPDESLLKVEKYLDGIAQDNGARYPYQRGGDVRVSMTAEALLMRQYLGWRRDDPRLISGVDWITLPENLINFKNDRNVYYWYYATQVAHHMEGSHWKRWNKVMRQILPEQQVSRGKESGSWDPNKPSEDQWANHGGRLYVTCLSIYMLEVYYRHMPIYSKVYSRAAAPLKPAKESSTVDDSPK